MSLPWVSRAAFRRVVGEANHAHQRAILAEARETVVLTSLAAERTRYDALLEKYHAAVTPSVTTTTAGSGVQRLEVKADPVNQAIIQRMHGRPHVALRDHYLAYVRSKRAEHVPEELIAQAILEGHDFDPTTEGIP